MSDDRDPRAGQAVFFCLIAPLLLGLAAGSLFSIASSLSKLAECAAPAK